MIDNRMFDFEDFYNDIAKELPNNCVIAEVGVAVGASALYLAHKLNELGKVFTLYMIDNMDYGNTDQFNIIYKNIINSNLGKYIELVWMDSLNASCRFPDVHFDFVFIDASHKYELTKADIRLWYNKVKEGGILAGHDYNDNEGIEVKMAVDEVIPKEIIYINEKRPTKVLDIKETNKNFNIWSIKKYWQIKLDTHYMPKEFNWRDCYISYINLDYRNDRRDHMEKELSRVGIEAIRFSALKTSEHKWDNLKTSIMLNRTPGAIGCHYSQVSVMEEALKEWKDAFVMEDDLIFCTDIKERLDYIQYFLNKHEWDVFFLGGTVDINNPYWHKKGHNYELQTCDCSLERDAERTDDPRILRTYGAFSTHCYIVNKNSIEKILKYFDENLHLSIGIDYLFIKMQPQLKAFMFLPGCVKQRDNLSDIGNGITYFSGFSKLGKHWWADKMEDFNPDTPVG